MLLDPGTKGGSLFLSLLLFLSPLLYYAVAVRTSASTPEETQRDISLYFTTGLTLAWTASYLFRVASKDMTYAKQLRDYEDRVIEKRMEELDEEERRGLVESLEREEGGA